MTTNVIKDTEKDTHTHTEFYSHGKEKDEIMSIFLKMKANEYINILNKIRQTWNN